MKMDTNIFNEGYFQNGVGSNYHDYVTDDGDKLSVRLSGFVPIIKLCMKYSGMPNKVLVIGGAVGYEALILKKFGVQSIINTDVSKYAIDNAKHTPSILHDIREPLNFDDNSFDLVYCGDVLEHIEEGNQESIAKEIARVCSGNLFITHPTSETIKWYGDDTTHITIKPHQWWVDIYSPYFNMINNAPRFLDSRSYFFMEKRK